MSVTPAGFSVPMARFCQVAGVWGAGRAKRVPAPGGAVGSSEWMTREAHKTPRAEDFGTGPAS